MSTIMCILSATLILRQKMHILKKNNKNLPLFLKICHRSMFHLFPRFLQSHHPPVPTVHQKRVEKKKKKHPPGSPAAERLGSGSMESEGFTSSSSSNTGSFPSNLRYSTPGVGPYNWINSTLRILSYLTLSYELVTHLMCWKNMEKPMSSHYLTTFHGCAHSGLKSYASRSREVPSPQKIKQTEGSCRRNPSENSQNLVVWGQHIIQSSSSLGTMSLRSWKFHNQLLLVMIIPTSYFLSEKKTLSTISFHYRSFSLSRGSRPRG